MVTFTADYWVPGLNNKARRRQQLPEPLVTRKACEKSAITPSTNCTNSLFSPDLFDAGASDFSSSSSSSQSPSPRSASPKHHSSEEKFLSNVKSIWSDILNTKSSSSPKNPLSPQSSSTSSSTSNIQQQGKSLSEKYGVCERKSIGKGATAVVKVAHKLDREQKEQHFAVKEFRKKRKDETQKEYIKKLTSEFCISSALVHTNVVSTIDLIQDEHQNWCQVMEYCPGGDLYNIIKTNHMTEKEINCCFKQLILGLNYLHSMGVAHRDIKPENLIFDDFCHLKITDFGVSDVFKTAWETTSHRSRGLCGSEPYIAPEMWTDDDYDARLIDIWACGIVYYSMRHRSIPFRMASMDDSNYKSFVEKRRKGVCTQFNQYSEGCKRLMERILEPNPSDRITMAEILEDEWFQSIQVCSHGDVANGPAHCHYTLEYLTTRMKSK